MKAVQYGLDGVVEEHILHWFVRCIVLPLQYFPEGGVEFDARSRVGGCGSGPQRPGGWKRAGEDLPALDLRDLRAAGALSPGHHAGAVPLRWRMGELPAAFDAEGGADAGTVQMTADLPTGPVEWDVGVVAAGCGRVGRWWLPVCSVLDGAGAACGRRGGRL